MKHSYVLNYNTEEVPANWDFVFIKACDGMTRMSDFNERANFVGKSKVGAYFVPNLAKAGSVNEQSSFFKWFLDDNYEIRNNDVPLLMEMFDSQGKLLLTFSQFQAMIGTVKDKWHPELSKKVLVPFTKSVWQTFMNNDASSMKNMRKYFEPVMVYPGDPGTTNPGILADFGVPKWWEYDYVNHLFAYSENGWDVQPIEEPIEEPIEDPSPEEKPNPIDEEDLHPYPEEDPVELIGEAGLVVTEWKLTIFGIPIAKISAKNVAFWDEDHYTTNEW